MKICALKDTRSPKMCWGFLKAGHGTNRDVSDLDPATSLVARPPHKQDTTRKAEADDRYLLTGRKHLSLSI